MTTASITTNAARSPAETSALPAAAQRRERDDVAEDVAVAGGVAFDLVLDAMRGLARSARAGFEGRASAAQVFEPVSNDAHGQRQSSLENDYRADVADRADSRQTLRNGVEARREALTEASSANEAARARATQAIEEDRSGALRGQTLRNDVESVLGKSTLRALQADANGEGRPRLGADGDSRSAAPRDTQSAAPLASPRDQAGSPKPAPSGGVHSVARSGRSAGSNPASRLAQVLASSRSSGAEMAKSTAVAAGAAKPGGRGESSARAAKANPGQTSRFVPGDQSTTGSSTSVEKTPFDELVRSMRLQTGTRYSSARIHLNPPELGRIQVDIRVVADRTRIEIRTENPAAKRLLERRGAQLVDALERQGITLDTFEVFSEAFDTDPTAVNADGASPFAERQSRGEGSPGTSSAAGQAGLSTRDVAPEAEPEIAHAVVSETRLDIKI